VDASKAWDQTRTQSRFTGQIGLFQEERGQPGLSGAQGDPTTKGLNNVCACTRSHAGANDLGANSKPRKNGGVFREFRE